MTPTCPDCSHPIDDAHQDRADGSCERCDDAAGVGEYAPCTARPLEYCAPEEIAQHCPAGLSHCPGHPIAEPDELPDDSMAAYAGAAARLAADTPNDLPAGAVIDDDPEAFAAELVAEYREAIERQRATWQRWRRASNGDRHAVATAGRLTADELASAAARFGLVAGPIPLNAGGDATYAPRMHEASDVWGAIVTAMRETYHGSTQRTDWPYDATTERYNFSPSGPWHSAPPPIYAAGLTASSASATQQTRSTEP